MFSILSIRGSVSQFNIYMPPRGIKLPIAYFKLSCTLVSPSGESSNVEKKYCFQRFHLLGLLFIVSMNYPRHDMTQIYQFYLMDQIKRGVIRFSRF